ncbi:MAG: FCD domain-containing protein, partial [Anaerolineae bacterium]
AEHRAILDAIRRKDVQGAREILKKHLLIPDL